jgi:hypothetical protein
MRAEIKTTRKNSGTIQAINWRDCGGIKERGGKKHCQNRQFSARIWAGYVPNESQNTYSFINGLNDTVSTKQVDLVVLI